MSTILHILNAKPAGAEPRYESIADAISEAIRAGRLKPGDRLPTVRRLAAECGVSLTTAAAAFKSLAGNGWTRGEIGRGTFVTEKARRERNSPSQAPEFASSQPSPLAGNPWRRRTLVGLMSRLRSTYPQAVNCSFGGPGAALLPIKIIKRRWKSALDDVADRDLQYKTVDPIGALTEILPQRMALDGIPVTAGDLIAGTSAQQFIALATDVARRRRGSREPVFAVEQPGYYTIFDSWDHAGVRMIGVETDENGARPESLDSAIRAGANAVLLTPRAHNPTGACWTPERLRSLADVLSLHPHVLAIEDDHFADIAQERSGSLLADARVEDRVVYIRSFSKSIAPDLRLSIAAARPPVKTLLEEAKSHADGWSSRLLQRVLAGVLQDDSLSSWLAGVRRTYRTRRERVAEVLANRGLPGVVVWPARDGVNLWIQLPRGFDANEVVERAAALGVLVAPGEVFFLAPGHGNVVRFNVGSIQTEQASGCAELLVKAIRTSGGPPSIAIHV